MRSILSSGEMFAAIVISALLCGPQAIAQMSDYSTDMEEPDMMTVKNDYCCHSERLKQEANVEINIKHALLTTFKPIGIQVLDANDQEIAHVSTRDKVVYMHLPEGHYKIIVNAVGDHKTVTVNASENTLKDFVI